MRVLKFGGSSVADAACMQQTAAIISRQPFPSVIVVSALGGTTNTLLQCGRHASTGSDSWKAELESLQDRHLQVARTLLPPQTAGASLSSIVQGFNEIASLLQGVTLLRELSPATGDRLLGWGELLSAQLLTTYLQSSGIRARYLDARDLILTDERFGCATVHRQLTEARIAVAFAASSEEITVVPGFIACSQQGRPTTLGRGGSDYTAALLGAALSAERVEIWTDVSGLMTADPRIVPRARAIPQISYGEAMELSHFGAKVLYPPTLQPLQAAGIPALIRNTFAPADEGTLITAAAAGNGPPVRGISSISDLSLVTLEGSGMVGVPGFSRRLFQTLAAADINVVLITQASSEHSICVGIRSGDAPAAEQRINAAFSHEIAMGHLRPVRAEEGLAIVALVGDRMKRRPGTSGAMFGALGRNGINVRAIAQGSSERNITAVVQAEAVQQAVHILHETFFESVPKVVHLFIAGTGNVGRRLLAQLDSQRAALLKSSGLDIRVAGLINSRKMQLDKEGVRTGNGQLQDGAAADLAAFVGGVVGAGLRNSVFVDVTANESVAATYETLLEGSVSVVACNKIAAASGLQRYYRLKGLARERRVPFLFETNVGAGLPLIGTLSDLLRSGDVVHRIEAVLSGTLNYVFNHYDGREPFAHVVKAAQREGYTEPDPRLDLSGTDVARKILILAREAGYALELEDVAVKPFLPPSCLEGGVDQFYEAMEGEEPYFRNLLATAEGGKLKYVARLGGGKASAGLERIEPGHDFFHLYGKDNIVLFYTDRYHEQPLVVKGAGAGAEVTASGVFADILRAAREA